MNKQQVTVFVMALVGATAVYLVADTFSANVFRTSPPAELAYSLDIPEPAPAAAPSADADDDAAVDTAEAAPAAAAPPAGDSLPALLAAASADDGAKVFRKCAACHKVEDGKNAVGPHLYGVVGRPVGAVADFRYSGALSKVAEVWDFQTLFDYLEDPRGYAPGTSMAFAGLAKPEDRAAVIVYLNEAGPSPLPLPEVVAVAAEAPPAEEVAAEEPAAEVAEAPADEPAETAAVEPAPAEEPVAEAPAPAEPELSPFAAALLAADIDRGAQEFAVCAACHTLQENRHGIGPSLYGVVGRPIAGAAAFPYSKELAAIDGDWTPERLNEYLTDPRGFVGGSHVVSRAVPTVEGRAALIAFLNQHGAAPIDLAATVEAEAPAAPAPAPAEEAAAEPEQRVAAAPAEEPAAEEPVAEAPAAEEAPAEEAVATAPAAEEPAPAAEAAPAAGGSELAVALASATAADGAKAFRKCAACHKIEDGKNGVGPHLWNVVGRPVASVDGFRYSDALQGLGGEWTFDRLSAYLENPKGYAPGNKMAFAGLRDLDERAALLRYLNEEGGSNFRYP
ncbi:MAG: hypothetical protein EA355_15375 [Rhodobacteraceae bacterium]|nr:MAG: hypothetical protein EA355_15375 [Paracoccaceae bacterium]